jgi:hypothetical protein
MQIVFIRSVSLVALYDRLYRLIWSVLSRSFHSDTCLTPTTNTIFFLHKHKIPPGRIVTYARFICTFRPEKTEQNSTRLTVGGNLITDYTGETSTDTAGLELIKLHWLSVLSTKNAKYMTMDIGNFYLNSPLDRFEYMRINISDVPLEVIDE